MAGTTGLEPATSAVTGQRSNQLSYVPNNRFILPYRCGLWIWVQLIPAHSVLSLQKSLNQRNARGKATRRNQVGHPQA